MAMSLRVREELERRSAKRIAKRTRKKGSGRPRTYPKSVVSSCWICGRIFARWIEQCSHTRNYAYCSDECKDKRRSKSRKAVVDLKRETKLKFTNRRTVDSIPSPTSYEKQLWG